MKWIPVPAGRRTVISACMPGISVADPVIHQTVLEETSDLEQGKPVVLGSLDLPGSTRHQEVEVVSELLR